MLFTSGIKENDRGAPTEQDGEIHAERHLAVHWDWLVLGTMLFLLLALLMTRLTCI